MKTENNELTKSQYAILRAEGLTAEPEEVPEVFDLWVAIRESGVHTLQEFTALIQRKTGWSQQEAQAFAQENWEVAKKLIATAPIKTAKDLQKELDDLRAKMREIFRDWSENWDCDTGANNSHPSYCRVCKAAAILKELEK